MKLLSAHIEDLKTLYIQNLKKALDMEQKITAALPDLIQASNDSELKEAFSTHLQETRGQSPRSKASSVSTPAKPRARPARS